MDVQMKELHKLYEIAVDKASRDRDWYRNRKDQWKFWSRGIRVAVWIALLIGAACPFMPDNYLNINWLKVGYGSVIIAGLIFALDQFLLFSKTWIRYVTTQVKIDERIDVFTFEWEKALAKLAYTRPGGKKHASLISLLENFVRDVKGLVIEEAESWSTDLNDALQLIERKISRSEEEIRETIRDRNSKPAQKDEEQAKLAEVDSRTQIIAEQVSEFEESLRANN